MTVYIPSRLSGLPFFWPHRLHTVHKMRPIATDVAYSVVCVSVCLSMCVLGIQVSCAKTAEPIEMPFGG